MIRLLLLVGLFLLAAYLVADRVALLLAGMRGGGAARLDHDDAARRELVACAGCGVHVPRARALEIPPAHDAGARFCCSERCRARLAAVPR